MLQRIVGLIATVVGVIIAFLIGLWALVSLAFVAAGAAIVYAFRSRDGRRAREKRRHRDVIEGEFSVVDEKKPGERHDHKGGPSGRDSPP
jgi:membrane protein implicated in regulation of membrane protease activity